MPHFDGWLSLINDDDINNRPKTVAGNRENKIYKLILQRHLAEREWQMSVDDLLI